MGKQIIVNQAIDRYHRLDKILRSGMLREEEAAFLQGRQFELILLIYTLDEQAIVRLTESSVDGKPGMVDWSRLRKVNLN